MIYTTPTGQQIVIPDDMNLGLTAAPMGVNPPLPTMPLGAPPALEAPAPAPPDVTAFVPGQGPLGAPNPLEGPAPVPQADFKAPPIAPPAKPAKPAPAPKPLTAEQTIEAAGNAQAQAQAQQAAIARQQGELEAQQAGEVAGIERAGLTEADIAAETAAAVQAKRDEEQAKLSDNYRAMVKKEAETKVDQSGGWKNASTGRKVLAGISVALSGLSDVLMRRTGPNAAMQIIKSAVDDDIAAQVREREQAGKRIGYARNSLDDYQRETGAIMDAHKMKQAEGYERVARQVRVTAAEYGSPVAKLRAEQVATGFEQQAAALVQQTAEGKYNRDVKKQELALQRQQVGIAGANLKLSRDQFEWGKRKDILAAQAATDAAKSGGIAGSVRQEIVNGQPRMVSEPMMTEDGQVWNPDAKTKGEVIAKRASVQSLHDVLGALKKLRAEEGGASSKFSPAAQARYNQLTNQAMSSYATMTGRNMGDEADREFVRNAILGDDPSKFHTSEVDTRIDQALSQFDADFNNILVGHRVKPIKFFDLVTREPQNSANEEAVKGVIGTSDLDSPEKRRGGYGFTDIIKESPAVRVMSEVKQLISPNDPGGLNQASRSKEDAAALPAIKQTLDAQLAMARSTDPAIAEQGRKNLQSIWANATSDGVRTIALEYMHRIGAPTVPPKK